MLSDFVATVLETELREGTMLGVKVGEDNILLARVEGQIYAINNICSHFYTHLTNGELITELLQVRCPLHDSCFDLRTGEPTEPPAEERVETYQIKVEGGLVYVGPS